MKGPRARQFLAGAGLAEQQHGGVQHRSAPRAALDLERALAVADEVREGVARAPLARELLVRQRQLALQAAELADQRLERFDLVVEDQAHCADHRARVVAQRKARHEVGARLVLENVEQDRLAGLDHVPHQRVRHDLLDRAADDLLDRRKAQARHVALPAIVGPDDARRRIDDEDAFALNGELVEESLRRHAQHALGIVEGLERAHGSTGRFSER